MATIYDVARHAGVAISTVSRVINNDPRVSERTREKVMKAIEEIGYQPHALARNLARRRTDAIGVVAPVGRHIFRERFAGMQQCLGGTGKILVLYDVPQQQADSDYLENLAGERKVDAMVFVNRVPSPRIVQCFQQANIPMVLVDDYHDEIPSLTVDDVAGGYLAAKHLIESGHKRIAYIGGPADNWHSNDRYVGYKKALVEAGLPFDETLVRFGDWERSAGFRLMEEIWLTTREAPPTAVITSDVQAVGIIMDFLPRHDLTIGPDFSIVGYDDLEIAELLNLTTIRQPAFQMGYRAIEVVNQLLEEPDSPWKHEVFAPELVVRKSVVAR